jgi:hypothetical protein
LDSIRSSPFFLPVANTITSAGRPFSRYAYTNDAVGRRTSVETSGWAFSQPEFNLWSYNTRSELERGTGTQLCTHGRR